VDDVQLCLEIPPLMSLSPSTSLQFGDEACGVLWSNGGLVIAYRSGTVRRVILSTLSTSRDDGGLFLSYRDAASCDLIRELRLSERGSAAVKGSVIDDVGVIKRDIKAITLAMDCIAENVVIVTTDALIILNEVSFYGWLCLMKSFYCALVLDY
jgi:hypothetical protein